MKHRNKMNREEHERIVAAGIKSLGIKQHETSDLDRLMDQTREKLERVRFYAHSVVKEHRLALRGIDQVMLAKDITNRFTEEFKDYSKDELFMTWVIFLSQITMQEVV